MYLSYVQSEVGEHCQHFHSGKEGIVDDKLTLFVIFELLTVNGGRGKGGGGGLLLHL